ncbi:probable cyclic nucleotide-gated ion channel 20, chloroplastic [Triticum urartu]|uniref:probable cyclic nucleotide-gated ion channel 20, chloroplastic n=1 Tax=Triticum urartu TaxID=4572 RepID=UPI002043B078|nr:probable cyclic nucleotide-gated ion channel 20, chloroplastic [Triticum urartu]
MAITLRSFDGIYLKMNLSMIRLFALKDCGLCDAVCDKLKHKLYVRGSDILSQDHLVEKIIFVVRGKLESISADGSKSPLHEGAVCGEELLMWWLESSKFLSDGERMKLHWKAIRTIRCLTNVEAFVLQFTDLERITLEFSTVLQNPRVIAAIRYDSPSWRTAAAIHIHVVWRHRQRQLKGAALLQGFAAMLGSFTRKRESNVYAIEDPHVNFQRPYQHNLVVPGMLLLNTMS